MPSTDQFLSPSEAARQLGISTKALRLYEQRGLVAPVRSSAGWRAYGPAEIARASQIAALRALGFSLAQIARVLDGNPQGLEPALAAHQDILERRLRDLVGAVETIRGVRQDLAQGRTPTLGELAQLAAPPADVVACFELPWPWGGERFELRGVRPLNFIVGPLGSGKTRLARRLAETLTNAAFLAMEDRNDGDGARQRLEQDGGLRARVERTSAWLEEEGASSSDALLVLLVALETEGPDALVVDLVEHGLDEATQEALIAHLRRRGADARPLFLMTRSSAILDLPNVEPLETILYCPANHSPPMQVAAVPGSPGYEAVLTCLAPPDVRARTEGMIAWRPPAS